MQEEKQEQILEILSGLNLKEILILLNDVKDEVERTSKFTQDGTASTEDVTPKKHHQGITIIETDPIKGEKVEGRFSMLGKHKAANAPQLPISKGKVNNCFKTDCAFSITNQCTHEEGQCSEIVRKK